MITAIQCRACEVKSPHPHVFGGAYAEYFCAAAPQGPLQDADGCADFRSAGRSMGVCGQSVFEQIYDVLVSSPRPRVLEGARCQTVDECFEEIAFKGIDCLLTCNGARPVLMTAERGKSVRDAKLAYRDRNETSPNCASWARMVMHTKSSGRKR